MQGKRRWFGLVFISLAVALIIVDSTIVAVTIPAIVADLGLTSTQVQWVQESYTLMFAALLLTFGSIADRIGRRRMLVIGLAIFAIASLGVVFSGSGGVMIAWRLVQSIGGAMIMPSTLSLINANYTGRDRGIAFAVWGSTIGGMAALGPLLGGWLATAFSWHWAFAINPPLVLVIGIGVLVTVAESREERPGRLDVVGAALATVMSAALVFGLIEGRTYGWWLVDEPLAIGGWTWPFDVSVIPLSFVVAILALVVFIARSVRRDRAGRSTLLDLGLFRLASFRNGNLVAAIVSLGEFGIILTLPLWMQNVLGYDPLHAGYTLVALAAGSFVSSGLVQPLGKRVAPVQLVRLGLVLEIIGILVVALAIGPDTSWVPLAIGLGVYGMGVGFATAQLTGVVLVDVPLDRSGQASGTQSTSRQVGSALGIAILGTILFGVTSLQLGASLPDLGLPAAAVDGVVSAVSDSAGGAIQGLQSQGQGVFDAAREAFSVGTRAAAFTAAGFLVLALLASISLGRTGGRQGETDEGREGARTATAGTTGE